MAQSMQYHEMCIDRAPLFQVVIIKVCSECSAHPHSRNVIIMYKNIIKIPSFVDIIIL